jgi:hypothetical protein
MANRFFLVANALYYARGGMMLAQKMCVYMASVSQCG